MTHLSYKKYLAGFLIALYSLSSCHKDTVVPATLIPLNCQIELAVIIDGPNSTTMACKYDAFGDQISRKDSSSDGSKTERLYTFDADHYLVSQKANSTVYTYTYTDTPKRISHIEGGAYVIDYTYDGDNLKTFVVKNGNAVSTYEFTSNKLSTVTISTGEQITINTDGKIAKRITTAGVETNYKYDGQGQATEIETMNTATGERTVSGYTYDTNHFYTFATLRARGFPVLALDGQPGYDTNTLGFPIQLNNLLSITTKSYKKDASGTEVTVATNMLTYRHQYSHDYSLGYARSDGARAKFYYINCKQ